MRNARRVDVARLGQCLNSLLILSLKKETFLF